MSDVRSNGWKTGSLGSMNREEGEQLRPAMAGQPTRRPLSDTSKWVIYIDLDEALPAEGEPNDEAALSAWIGQIAALVSPHPDVGIAFHGTWSVKHSLAHAEMLVGVLDRLVIGFVAPGLRADAILAHIYSHPEVLDCLVLDSHVEEFQPPLAEHLIALEAGGSIRRLAALEQVGAWIEARRSARPHGDPCAVRQRLLAGFVAPPPRTGSSRTEPETVDAVVTVLIEEFELVHLETAAGLTLSIGDGTNGVDWRTLRLGQRLRCLVEGEHCSRVLSAEVLNDR